MMARSELDLSHKFDDLLLKSYFTLKEKGCSTKEIERKLGITDVVFRLLEFADPDTLHTKLNEIKLKAKMVEASMLKMALGYETEDSKHFFDSQRGEVVEHKYTKRVQPSLKAAQFLLKNYNPEEFKETPEVNININSGVNNMDEARQILASDPAMMIEAEVEESETSNDAS